MRKILLAIVMLLGLVTVTFSQNDYYVKKAQSYQREAAYYTRRGDIGRAKTQTRYAEDAMDRYKMQMRYAANADEKAAMFLRWASEALRKH